MNFELIKITSTSEKTAVVWKEKVTIDEVEQKEKRSMDTTAAPRGQLRDAMDLFKDKFIEWLNIPLPSRYMDCATEQGKQHLLNKTETMKKQFMVTEIKLTGRDDKRKITLKGLYGSVEMKTTPKLLAGDQNEKMRENLKKVEEEAYLLAVEGEVAQMVITSLM